MKVRPKAIDTEAARRRMAEEFRSLSHRILHSVSRDVPRVDFLREVSKILMDFSGCDALELRLGEATERSKCEVAKRTNRSFRFEIVPCVRDEGPAALGSAHSNTDFELFCSDVLRGQFDSALPFFTRKGSFWLRDAKKPLTIDQRKKGRESGLPIPGNYRSLAVIPLALAAENIGLMQLKSKKPYYFTETEIELYEGVAKSLAVALVHQRSRAALHERVKELTCLYGIAQVSEKPGATLRDILRNIVELLPPAWQYPEITSARITLDGHSYSTTSFKETPQRQAAELVVHGKKRGSVEVAYSQRKPELDEGPFLKEERSLIDAVARQVALVIERRQAEEDRSRLQDQLRHADRLATIGQLAAGVAHELNEPLGNILGFAQLARKFPGVPEQTVQDIDKIASASLHAREVVKKLMMFARQMPPKKGRVNLNSLVEEGLYLLESRCAKEGIDLVRRLSTDLPDIIGDPAQLNQVLVNLAVNAIHAMPKGGRLTVRTLASDDYVSLVVEDTGIGMSEETVKQIFIPFFTTKDIGEGTGLGLSVVHGIVSSHGGFVKVESKIGHGSKFEVQLPLTGPDDLKENDKDDKSK